LEILELRPAEHTHWQQLYTTFFW